MIYTPKQRGLMMRWKQNRLHRLNLLEGSVSSGKTWISLVLWAFWVATMPKDKLYLMCGKSLTTLKRNCLVLLEELVGSSNFVFSLASKEGYLFGRRVLLEGANDARSESKIRGLTLQGGYCDELTLFPKDFFAMLLSRLRVPGAKLIATTNPDSPKHWLMQEYINRANDIDLLDVPFLLDDNTTLDPEYVAAIKREYTGVFYDRFILGRWVAAEGRIYDMFDEAKNVVPSIDRPYTAYYVSMDYGTQNPTAMLLWGKYSNAWYAIREYYYSGRNAKRQKTDEEYYKDLETFAGGLPIKSVIIDPSAASMIACIRAHHKFRVRSADNTVIDGIRNTATALSTQSIMICDCCTNTLAEIESYVWDEKASLRGEDKPVKENDHAMDAMRYFCQTVLRGPVFDFT